METKGLNGLEDSNKSVLFFSSFRYRISNLFLYSQNHGFMQLGEGKKDIHGIFCFKKLQFIVLVCIVTALLSFFAKPERVKNHNTTQSQSKCHCLYYCYHGMEYSNRTIQIYTYKKVPLILQVQAHYHKNVGMSQRVTFFLNQHTFISLVNITRQYITQYRRLCMCC